MTTTETKQENKGVPCPKCGKSITKLFAHQSACFSVTFDGETYGDKEWEDKPETHYFECPLCGEEICEDEQAARDFLSGKLEIEAWKHEEAKEGEIHDDH